MKMIFGPFGLAMGMTAILILCGYSNHANAGDTCNLLSQAQVGTVIPGNDGGKERDTSEAALFKDVEMGHCSYMHVEGMDLQFLDLITYETSTDEGFEQIEISGRAQNASVGDLGIGDVSYFDEIDPGTIRVAVSTGRTVIELTLNSQDAPTKKTQLIELARSVAGKL